MAADTVNLKTRFTHQSGRSTHIDPHPLNPDTQPGRNASFNNPDFLPQGETDDTIKSLIEQQIIRLQSTPQPPSASLREFMQWHWQWKWELRWEWDKDQLAWERQWVFAELSVTRVLR